MRASIFPLYFFNRAYYRDAYGEHIYLSDGGHSENLGAWSLVRRQCEQIIIVDAEYDPNYTFEAYFKLKRALGQEMNVSFALDEDPASKIEIDKIPAQIDESRKMANINDPPGPFPDLYNPANPVLHGTIGPFPYIKNDGTVGLRSIDVVYIKLALDGDRVKKMALTDRPATDKEYGKAAVDYYLKTINNSCEKRPPVYADLFIQCHFPHYDTKHQSYAPEQFAAYVDLGEHTVSSHIKYDTDEARLAILKRALKDIQ